MTRKEGTTKKSGWQKRTLEWCEMKVGKTVRSNNRIVMIHSVHPASKYTDMKSVQRPLLESEGTSNCRVVSELVLHQTAQLYSQGWGLSLRPPHAPKQSRAQGLLSFVFLGQSAGTSIWVSQVSLNHPNAHLLGNQHTAQSFLEPTVLSSEANPTLKNKTPKGWEVQFPPGSPAPRHSSTLAWAIPWTEEAGRLQSAASLSQTQVGDWTTRIRKFS